MVMFEDQFTMALDLNERISGENLIGEKGRTAFIGDAETEEAIVGRGPIAEEFRRQLPVERSVEELTDSNHHVTAHVGDDPHIIRHVQLGLACPVVQLAVTRQRQLSIIDC